jgi:hypothetical protein
MAYGVSALMTKLGIILEESHKDLYQWFLLHQECLLLAHNDYAEQCWAAFKQGLLAHIEFENNYLLNDNGLLADIPLRWQLDLYRKEHNKVLQKLGEIDALFAQYLREQGRAQRIYALELFEKQVSFRHLLEHHETREEQDLLQHLPVLDNLQMDDYVAFEQQWQSFKQEVKAYLQAV